MSTLCRVRSCQPRIHSSQWERWHRSRTRPRSFQTRETPHRVGQRSKCWRAKQRRRESSRHKGKESAASSLLCRSTVRGRVQRWRRESGGSVTKAHLGGQDHLLDQVGDHLHVGHHRLHVLLLLRKGSIEKVVADLCKKLWSKDKMIIVFRPQKCVLRYNFENNKVMKIFVSHEFLCIMYEFQ